MTTLSGINKVAALMALATLLLAGCAGYLRPQLGALAHKEARIALEPAQPQGLWETGDLRVNYALTAKDGTCSLEGKVVINDSIGNSFPTIAKFFFYLSFLDEDGRVVETVDISPVIPTFGRIPASLPLRMTRARPPQATHLVFHYYGAFRANPLREGGTWDIYHFPFAR